MYIDTIRRMIANFLVVMLSWRERETYIQIDSDRPEFSWDVFQNNIIFPSFLISIKYIDPIIYGQTTVIIIRQELPSQRILNNINTIK